MARKVLVGAGFLVALAIAVGLLFSLPATSVATSEGPEGSPDDAAVALPPATTDDASEREEAGRLAGDARARVPTSTDSTEPLPAAAPEPAAAVDPKGPFRGLCVDEAGAPVAGAVVQVVNGRAARGGIDPRRFAEARSGGDGRFEIPAPEGVLSIRVRASAPGRVAGRADHEVVRGAVARIVLLSSVEVRVRVLEREGGGAVRGARVTLLAGELNANSLDVDFALRPPTV